MSKWLYWHAQDTKHFKTVPAPLPPPSSPLPLPPKQTLSSNKYVWHDIESNWTTKWKTTIMWTTTTATATSQTNITRSEFNECAKHKLRCWVERDCCCFSFGLFLYLIAWQLLMPRTIRTETRTHKATASIAFNFSFFHFSSLCCVCVCWALSFAICLTDRTLPSQPASQPASK